MAEDELRNEQPEDADRPGAEEQLTASAHGDGAGNGSGKSVSGDGAGEEVRAAEERTERRGGLDLAVECGAEQQQAPALPYPVVAFGASAGGLQALKEVLENLDSHTGMAFVLVTHLAPDQRSFLSEIVERYTQMPVVEVENGQRPLANHLYVVMPNQSVTLVEGEFHVERRAASERIPRTIDKFFHSLAADQKNQAVGVVLSGADGDGALGAKAIKGEGGIVIVQTPGSAVQSGMPRSSIASDHVDLVIPPAEIAMELARLAHQFTRPEVRLLEEGAPVIDDQTFQKILQQLRGVAGIDFRQYKPETLRRRVARRMILLRTDRLGEYLRQVQVNSDELRNLHEDSLINVTRFFRDSGLWESLRTTILPVLFQDRSPDKPIRIWSAGCSTGEEAYSLAITVLEYMSQHGLDSPVQIFGTDVSDQSVEAARLAVYPEALISDISPERLHRYFVKSDGGYQVSKRVRDVCIFARQNLCTDPPFSHVDILSCRNVMIYFNAQLQRQIMLTFHYALEPGGYMLLGMSEGLRDYGDVFNAVDRKHKIYMKIGANMPFRYDPPRGYLMHRGGAAGARGSGEAESNIWPELELQRAADRIVLARYGPPGLIVDDRMNVLQSRGHTSQFLEIAPGAVSWNLPRILRESIASEVTAALQRAIREGIPVTEAVTIVDEQQRPQRVQVDVLPITSSAARPRCFLILFQNMAEGGEGKPAEASALEKLTVDEKERLIAQMRQDLNASRFHLQTLVEERDARNQELVSANEEIQSANEELQSTNEELETTKEELQSANEELQTVNDELQQRNNILTQTGNDLNNLLTSVNIPLLMLTDNLHIRQFTPPMEKLLSVRPTDIGRSIGELRWHLSFENIEPILAEVLETLAPRELEVQEREGRWYLLRVRPYRTAENKIEGLVVVLVDIDQLRRSQQLLMDARDFADSVVNCVPIPIVLLNRNLTIRNANEAFRQLAQMQTAEMEERSMPEVAALLWGIDSFRERLEPLSESGSGATLEFEHTSAKAPQTTVLITARVLSTDGDHVLLLMMEDITMRREAELLTGRHAKALEDEIATAGRELRRTQDELRGLTGHLFAAQEEERQRVARELHDDVSQRLSVLDIMLQGVADQKGAKERLEGLEAARKQLQALNSDVRLMSHRLHPAILNELGLSAALKSLVKEFGEREGMLATYSTENLPEQWSQDTATAIYRIAQEALRNVGKHAGKTHVKAILSGRDDRLELKVMDFGVGFDREAERPGPGLGMISMQERARLAGGTFSVQAELGKGTTVTVEVPLNAHG